MTLKEKSERYETVKRLLQAASYLSSGELTELKKITDNCYKRFENFKTEGKCSIEQDKP